MVSLEPINERHQMTNFQASNRLNSFNPNKLSKRNNKRKNIMSSKVAKEIIEQEQRPYDIIIFAASSSIGQFVVEELALIVGKQLNSSSLSSPLDSSGGEREDDSFVVATKTGRRESVPSSSRKNGGFNTIKWAIAGRSAVRLNETLGRAELETGIRNLTYQIPIILADLNKFDSLLNLCQQTKLIINCAGPYLEFGAELLIKASIECKTNYLDLSHEINFNEIIRLNYSHLAEQANVFIIQGCGFQSMSSELGLNFCKRFSDGQIEQVKIILDLNNSIGATAATKSTWCASIVSPGMWQSLIADKEQSEKISSNNSKLNWSTSKASDIKSKFSINKSHQLQRKDTQTLVKELVQFKNRNSLSAYWWPPVRLIQNVIIKLFSLLIIPNGFKLSAADDCSFNSRTGYTWPINSITSDECQLIRSEMSQYEQQQQQQSSIQNDANNQSEKRPAATTTCWRPIQCSNFISLKSFTELCHFYIWLFLFQITIKFSLTRKLMRKYPKLTLVNFENKSFSNGSSQPEVGKFNQISNNYSNSKNYNHYSSACNVLPFNCARPFDRAALSHIKFSQTFLAYGIPNQNDNNNDGQTIERKQRIQLLVSRIVGPEPNHVATATYAIQAALTILVEKDHLPRATSGQCGGVLTPGAAFAETNIIHQLRKRNIKFEVLKKA